ncbi:hypothetical protein CUR178_00873 [Leishmania enriettii]|uniref:Uncharacterized protein n=1 Tax=Leishmania enriettii TaxID=5663 RepID=A0A836FQJ5_LEIEN|nr:hypothetical protein CUR178_00873 [Leishmania enriettii]
MRGALGSGLSCARPPERPAPPGPPAPQKPLSRHHHPKAGQWLPPGFVFAMAEGGTRPGGDRWEGSHGPAPSLGAKKGALLATWPLLVSPSAASCCDDFLERQVEIASAGEAHNAKVAAKKGPTQHHPSNTGGTRGTKKKVEIWA